MTTHQLWPQERKNRLASMHGSMTILELAAEFGTTKAAIRGMVTRLGIGKMAIFPEWLAN